MSVKQFVTVAALAAVTGLGASVASANITIPTVPVGNPGNAADLSTGYGAVAYTYGIGTTEVTNAQYAAFLNAVAETDTYNLYSGDGVSTGMAGTFGGITRSGSPGSYTYATVNGRANNPVNFVSFWDATRFANWLHNGQPAGAQDTNTTEDGAYTLTRDGISANTITRNAGWQWAVTSDNEWYKAAYYQPASQGGDSDDYWLYPTSENVEPTTGQVNIVTSGFNNTVAVGSYAANFHGAFDMGGNVAEWTERIIFGDARIIRGGGHTGGANGMQTFIGSSGTATGEQRDIGFRVVQVPGPGSFALLAIGGVGALRRRRSIGR